MAPELIRSNESAFDEKVDIWSIGCIIFYILSGGKHAFSDDEDKSNVTPLLNQRIIHEEPDYENLLNEASPQAI